MNKSRVLSFSMMGGLCPIHSPSKILNICFAICLGQPLPVDVVEEVLVRYIHTSIVSAQAMKCTHMNNKATNIKNAVLYPLQSPSGEGCHGAGVLSQGSVLL